MFWWNSFQKPVQKRKQKGFQILHFSWSFSSGNMGVKGLKILQSTSEFGELGKHQNNPPCTKSVEVFKLLDTIRCCWWSSSASSFPCCMNIARVEVIFLSHVAWSWVVCAKERTMRLTADQLSLPFETRCTTICTFGSFGSWFWSVFVTCTVSNF